MLQVIDPPWGALSGAAELPGDLSFLSHVFSRVKI
jgi:hypothetical protein